MPSKEPNLLLKPHHLPYLAGGVAITLVVAVFALSLSGFLPTSTLAVGPSLSGGGPTDGATAQAVDATVSIVSNVALGPASFGTFTAQTSGTTSNLAAIDAMSATTAWAVGASGAILVTTNSGSTWTTKTSGLSSNLAGVDAIDANTAWFVGARVGGMGNGVIQKTTDGGTSWASQASGVAVDLMSIGAVDTNTAYVVGDTGTILRTTNAGTTWTAQTSNTSNVLTDVFVIDADTAWTAGASGTIRRTTNGGTTWATEDASGVTTQFNGVYGLSSSIAYVVGNGGAIYKTTNGGTSWSSQTSGTTNNLYSMYCVSSSICWAVGDSGTVLYTDDGGSVWASQTSNTTNRISGVHGVSATSAWFAANSGTLHVFGYNNVKLQANTGNTQAGSPTGTNLCTSLTLAIGVTLTCNHSALTKNTWYTFTLTTGVKSNTGDALSANVARAFRTIGAPSLSTASITDGQLSVATDAVITADLDNPLSTTSFLGSTWETRTASAAMNAIHLIDPSTAVAVGASGVTLSTVDGSAWLPGAAGSVTLNGVTFPNPHIGYAVGDSGTILKTLDLGTTWTAQTSGTTQNLKAVHCADAITCWGVGAAGTILKTTNGGTTWTAQTSGTTQTLFGLHVVDASTAYVVGNSTTILKTTNGGTAWTAKTGVVGNHGDVHCTSATVCWIASDTGLVYRTTDGGANWTAAVPELTVTWNGIHFASATTGWVVGTSGRIYTSTDGGVNWTQQTSGTTQGLNGVSFVSATTGVAVGSVGTALKTTNGGTTWTLQSEGTTVTLNGVHFSSVVVASGWTVGSSGAIFRSTNNGMTWTSQSSGTSVTLTDVFVLSANTGWVVGASGTIRKTTDGGATWSSQTSGTSEQLEGIQCVSPSTCFAVGGGTNAIALKTTDGGTSWSALSTGASGTLADTYFVSPNIGWVVGASGVIRKTTDGGSNWSAQTSGTSNGLFDIICFDSDTCVIVGASGTILSTSNGGTTWVSRTSGVSVDLRGIGYITVNYMLVVGDSGTTLKSTDGGVSWTTQTSGTTNHLMGVHIKGNGTAGWAVGNAGTIIVPQRNVRLQANASYARSGSAGGIDYCQSISLGADGSGNSDRRLTCTHGAFSPGMWYTLKLVGSSGGIASTSGTTDVLSADTTRVFRTAFGGSQVYDLTASDMGNLATNGYFTVTGSNSAASQAVLGPELRSTATTTHGTARVTVPAGCTFARSGGGNLDLTALATADAASDITNVSGTARGAIQYGIPNIGIALSSCGSGASIAIPVPSTVTAGTVLDVLRSEDTNFSNDTTRIGTCTVASSTCSFTTTSLSYFAASEPSGSPTQTDTTAPAAPTGLSATSSGGTITVTWTDPPDTDLSTIRILHIDPVSGATTLRGTVNKGIQTSTDSGTDLLVGTTYTVGVQAQDSSGNRSTTPTTTVTVSAAKAAAADTTAPAPPTSLTVTSAASKVTLTWKDPSDADLKLIRVLLLRGEATSIRSTLGKGPQTYTDSGTDLIPGLPVTFALEAEDTAGNKSSRVTTTVTVDSGTAPGSTSGGTSPPTTNQPSTNTTQPSTNTSTTEGAPKTTDTTTTPSTTKPSTEGAPKTTGTTTPVTPETELSKGVKADEPLPTDDPKATKLLRDAVKAITETLTPPCTLTDAERQYLADAFTRSQGRAPASGADLQFLCSLRADPTNPLDPTKAFPKYRNLQAETFALRNFVNFFRRPPSKDRRDRPLPPEIADRDWWAVKYMAYHLRLAPTARDLTGERTCLKLFLDRDVDLYKDGQKTRKARGTPPHDLFDYDFIRACTYSGVTFVSAAGTED